MKLLQRFIADSAHQIRTPLTALSAQVSLIDENNLQESDRRHLERVRNRAGELARFTNQLLNHAMVIHRFDSAQLVPLDLTRQVRTNDVRLQRIRAIDSAVSRAVTVMIEFYNVGEGAAEGASSGPLHDPCVIAYLLRPDLFVAEAAQVEVETQSFRTMGMTVIDTRLSDGRAANCRVLVGPMRSKEVPASAHRSAKRSTCPLAPARTSSRAATGASARWSPTRRPRSPCSIATARASCAAVSRRVARS